MEVIIMKMTTKLIVILLALSLMSVAFVGCNTQNDTQNPAGNANSQATEKETEPEILTPPRSPLTRLRNCVQSSWLMTPTPGRPVLLIPRKRSITYSRLQTASHVTRNS